MAMLGRALQRSATHVSHHGLLAHLEFETTVILQRRFTLDPPPYALRMVSGVNIMRAAETTKKSGHGRNDIGLADAPLPVAFGGDT